MVYGGKGKFSGSQEDGQLRKKNIKSVVQSRCGGQVERETGSCLHTGWWSEVRLKHSQEDAQ